MQLQSVIKNRYTKSIGEQITHIEPQWCLQLRNYCLRARESARTLSYCPRTGVSYKQAMKAIHVFRHICHGCVVVCELVFVCMYDCALLCLCVCFHKHTFASYRVSRDTKTSQRLDSATPAVGSIRQGSMMALLILAEFC